MIIDHIMEKNIAVIICKLLEQQKSLNVVLKISLKVIVKEPLRCLRWVDILSSKILKEK